MKMLTGGNNKLKDICTFVFHCNIFCGGSGNRIMVGANISLYVQYTYDKHYVGGGGDPTNYR